MTSLIHLNGPPGIGKSTLAALWTERHPGTLNLDIDTLHRLVGGWRDPDNRTHDVLRPVALAMAQAHLRGGRDVVVPQYLARLEEIEEFEAVAVAAGADLCEIVLVAEPGEAIARFWRREVLTPWDAHNRSEVERLGGAAFLTALNERLTEVLAFRPGAVIVHADSDAVEVTYAALEAALPR